LHSIPSPSNILMIEQFDCQAISQEGVDEMSEQRWSVTVATPFGPRQGILVLRRTAGAWTGEVTSASESATARNIEWTGNRLRWDQALTSPFPLRLRFDVTVEGDRLAGTARAGPFFTSQVAGLREGAPQAKGDSEK
jgi:hypothetical protein